MIDREHELPVVRQCEVLEPNRSTVYYEHQPTPPADTTAMFGNRFMAHSANVMPVVDRKFAFEDVTPAYEYLVAGGHFGKVVIRRLR